jgi:hypothetical protein
MTGFLARVVARATGREDSLAPRPDYRPDTGPSIFHDLPSPPAALSSLTPVSVDTGDVAFETPPRPGDLDAGRQPAAVAAATPVRGAARSTPQNAAPQAPYHSDADADPEPGVRRGPDRSGPRDSGDDADARLMPLAPAGSWDAAQPAFEVSPPDASRIAPSINHRSAAVPPLARAERIHRDATPAAQEPHTLHVHIGRIDVRAVHPAAPTPPALPKSRLQRPTLEAYLRNRERGRS